MSDTSLWQVDDVCEFLVENGFEKQANQFKKQVSIYSYFF